jgi:RimJ/RimL family protein N-acetyltransferase
MLRGEKVVLRSLEREDLRDPWELANDIEVESRSSNRAPRPSSLAQWEARFERREADPTGDRITFVVEVEGRLVGRCGLHGIDDNARRADLGIELRRDEWSKGLRPGRVPGPRGVRLPSPQPPDSHRC